MSEREPLGLAISLQVLFLVSSSKQVHLLCCIYPQYNTCFRRSTVQCRPMFVLTSEVSCHRSDNQMRQKYICALNDSFCAWAGIADQREVDGTGKRELLNCVFVMFYVEKLFFPIMNKPHELLNLCITTSNVNPSRAHL